jgi:low molecular weight protein-tyrosine phosphatase
VRFWRRAAEPVDVLVVCTGNLCRSPIIETLLAAAVPSTTVRSAGTAAPRGRPWHPQAVHVLAEAGHEVSGSARRLTAGDAQAAALVLTAAGMHRARVVELDPTAEERCFTLLEAARLLKIAPAPPGIGPAALAEHLTATMRSNPFEHDDDLADPIAGTIHDFRRCRDRVARAVVPVGEALSSPKI